MDNKKKKESNLKRFMNGFNILCYTKNKYEVWNDLMSLFAIELSNTSMRPLKDKKKFSEVWNKREKEYLNIISKYGKKEVRIITQMFVLLVLEFDDMVKHKKSFDDILGRIYMLLGISSSSKGQIFTPYSVSSLMSGLTMNKANVKQAIKENGYIKISDCACGAGSTLIAVIEKCDSLFKRLNYQNHIMFVCQDVDELCVKMCYIQLSLFCVCGIIKFGDTLSNPLVSKDLQNNLNNLWFTPIFYSSVWQTRFLFHGGVQNFI